MTAAPAVKPGEFRFSAIGLAHPHIDDQCRELIAAGGELISVYDDDPVSVERFRRKFPQAAPARCEREVLDDRRIRLVAGAAIPCDRAALGVRVMRAGKDYFTDKTPCTTLDQLAECRQVVAETGRRFFVYFGARVSPCALFAQRLISDGAIGRVVQVIGLGPHRLSAANRKQWFFVKRQYGGILCDIGIHQTDMFLSFTGNPTAEVVASQVGNYASPEYPELEDFGDMQLRGPNGATGYHRVDWLTPDGLGTWGDGRAIISGTEGYIELRKNIEIAGERTGDHLYLVDRTGERRFDAAGLVEVPFFRQMIRDCLDRSETAMTQAATFAATEIALTAQARAVRVGDSST
jgi:predicted dehydrogenase